MFNHVASIYKLVLDGFEQHVPFEARLISAKTISPSGLYLAELPGRLPFTTPRSDGPSMLSHVPGRDLRTMLWRETRAQMPHHNPAHEPLPTWIDKWHSGYNSGAEISTYTGVGL